jgi:hypothetical protein
MPPDVSLLTVLHLQHLCTATYITLLHIYTGARRVYECSHMPGGQSVPACTREQQQLFGQLVPHSKNQSHMQASGSQDRIYHRYARILAVM